MRLNRVNSNFLTTHEGGRSMPIKPLDQLKRLVLANMLWEDQFYVDGKTSADQIVETCARLSAEEILKVAVMAHKDYLLRHVPLLLVCEALKKPNNKAADYIKVICSRPDQMTELLAIYWKDGRKPIAKQLRKGLAKAFTQFDEYSLGKYNRDNAIKLRDIMFLCHPKPVSEEQPEMWKRLVNNELKTPDTWETRLSAGEDKKESFKELLENGKLGKLAILRNLRNMQESGVPKELVERELMKNPRPMLPFQFIAAAQACPEWESLIDKAMIESISKKEKLPGKTYLFVDVSGSMSNGVSGKSKISRMDAACAFAILLAATCEKCEVFSFSNHLEYVPGRQGMALRDAIAKSQYPSATMLGNALILWKMKLQQMPDQHYDRIIVITDEQVHDQVPPLDGKKYILNVAAYKNGLDTHRDWLVINGFSEASIDYIREVEGEINDVNK